MRVVAAVIGAFVVIALLLHFNYLPCAWTKLCDDMARESFAIHKEERKAALERKERPALVKVETSPAKVTTSEEHTKGPYFRGYISEEKEEETGHGPYFRGYVTETGPKYGPELRLKERQIRVHPVAPVCVYDPRGHRNRCR